MRQEAKQLVFYSTGFEFSLHFLFVEGQKVCQDSKVWSVKTDKKLIMSENTEKRLCHCQRYIRHCTFAVNHSVPQHDHCIGLLWIRVPGDISMEVAVWRQNGFLKGGRQCRTAPSKPITFVCLKQSLHSKGYECPQLFYTCVHLVYRVFSMW